MNSSFDVENARLEDWQQYIEAIHPAEIELGLERISVVADTLDLRKTSARVVTVAGTNGKGSTVEALRALLASLSNPKNDRGYAVGCYTSPHLLRFNERINVNGNAVEDEVLCAAFRDIECARGDIDLTYYEFTTLAALRVFQRQPLDVLILEVGLGGRLDAVNLLDADIAVITNIALDHTDWLGETRDEIAIEKAGILRPQQRLVLGTTDIPTSLQGIIDEQSKDSFTTAYYADLKSSGPSIAHGWTADSSGEGVSAWFGYHFNQDALTTQRMQIELSPESTRPLIPTLHLAAWSCAIQAALMLDADGCALRDQLARTDLATLMEQTALLGRQSTHAYASRQFVVDVAHNVASVEQFLQYYRRSRLGRLKQGWGDHDQARTEASINDVLIFGAMADKDIIGMLSRLLPAFRGTVLTSLPASRRAIVAEDLLASAASLGLADCIAHCSENVSAAIDWAVDHTSTTDRIYVVGSFITAAEALSVLQLS